MWPFGPYVLEEGKPCKIAELPQGIKGDSCACSGRHDRGPSLGVEARAAHEQPVDVRRGEQRRGVAAVDAAAVEDRYRLAALSRQRAEFRANQRVHRARVCG